MSKRVPPWISSDLKAKLSIIDVVQFPTTEQFAKLVESRQSVDARLASDEDVEEQDVVLQTMAITPWKILDSRYVVRDPWMTLRADRCETGNGVLVDPYYVQEPPDWVQIVAFDRHDRVLITRQYRHGSALICTEFPCGAVEPGEEPAQAARRELLEETGCTAQELWPLSSLSPNPARYSNKIYAFVATDTRHVQAQTLDKTEDIEFGFLTLSEVFSLIDQGGFPQALHLANLFLALRMRGLISLSAAPSV